MFIGNTTVWVKMSAEKKTSHCELKLCAKRKNSKIKTNGHRLITRIGEIKVLLRTRQSSEDYKKASGCLHCF